MLMLASMLNNMLMLLVGFSSGGSRSWKWMGGWIGDNYTKAAMTHRFRASLSLWHLLVRSHCKPSSTPLPHSVITIFSSLVQDPLISGMHWNVQQCKSASLRVQSISDATLKKLKLQHATPNHIFKSFS